MTGGQTVKGAHGALMVLGLINLLNYLDRYIVAGVLPKIEREFGIDHAAAGAVGTVFIVVYMVVSPISGYLGDRIQRRYLVAGSVMIWSLATVASGLAGSFLALLLARAVIGVGEAGYATVAPAIISDLFPKSRRTRMLAFFYVAIPVGAAAGYGLGGWIGETWSWRMAFFVGGAPGLVLALLMLRAPEPPRGASEVGHDATLRVPLRESLRLVSRTPMFWFNTVGLTMMTFSIGGLAYWMPSFLELERGFSATQSGIQFGAITAVAGLSGTLVGGVLGDWAERKREGGGMWVSGIGLLLAAPLMFLAATGRTPLTIFSLLFAAQFLLFLNSGPINAAILNCVSPSLRAFTMGLSTLLIHLFGDAISPPVIGGIAQASSLERAIELNAIPVLVGGAVLVAGALYFAREKGDRLPLPTSASRS